MKIALIHDWVIELGGAEKCLQLFQQLYPQAPLYTLLYKDASLNALGFDLSQVKASLLQRPGVIKNYRSYLPFYPYAIEQFDLSDYDVILSSSHCVAKGVLTNSQQIHICYCHTPIRYAWDLTHQYLEENRLQKGLKSALARAVLHYLRIWDASSSSRVDYFVANSRYTAARIWRSYRREAEVIYPPVNTEQFAVPRRKPEYFLFVSRLVKYKRADLVVAAFTRMGLPLVVVGDGPEMRYCKSLAGNNIEFVGYRNNEELSSLMAGARALVFAAQEDFGIVPVEAQASGTPVIALGKGGVTETVIPANGHNWNQATGIFFMEQEIDSLIEAVNIFLRWEDYFDTEVIRQNALRFNQERFKREIQAYVSSKYENKPNTK
ncbi:MAG: glycosyltransferase family 4 protein [Syntrophomonadaceae bacterium]|nr:glycosyltransferase family 4 protein [Syntrophomonadaceae bacterium]